MSYTIVYQKQFIRTGDGRIIPLVLAGSNNVWQGNKRCRSWFPILLQGIHKPMALPAYEIMQEVVSMTGNGCEEHFKYNGKWVNDKRLLSFYQNGLRDAKTVEELNQSLLFPEYLIGNATVWTGYNKRVESYGSIQTSQQMVAYLSWIDNLVCGKKPEEEIFPDLGFLCEKIKFHNRHLNKD